MRDGEKKNQHIEKLKTKKNSIEYRLVAHYVSQWHSKSASIFAFNARNSTFLITLIEYLIGR